MFRPDILDKAYWAKETVIDGKFEGQCLKSPNFRATACGKSKSNDQELFFSIISCTEKCEPSEGGGARWQNCGDGKLIIETLSLFV